LESAAIRNLGFDVAASDYRIRKDAYWFGEAQSRVVVSVRPEKVVAFKKLLGDHPCEELGFVTAGEVAVDGMDWGEMDHWKDKYDRAIEILLAGSETESALSAI
jgi:phosphoribosylformylglycinamidine synthase